MTANNTLWTMDELSAAIEGRWLSPPEGNVNIRGVCYYFGQIQQGDLVFAVSPNTWGSHYSDTTEKLTEIQNRGAKAVIVDRVPKEIPPHLPVYLCPNSLLALNQLGLAARTRFQGKAIFITGTVGKSSTKRGLAHVLSQQGLTSESRKNFNHSPGVPLSLAQTPTHHHYGVYEFGIDAPQYTLTKAKIACPDVAIVTEIQHDHHNFYPTLEAIVDQKSLLFSSMKPHGIAVLNRDTPYYLRLKSAALYRGASRIITFGEHRLANIRLVKSECLVDSSRVNVSVFGQTIDFQLTIPGKHNVRNSLAILAGVCAVNADYQKAAVDLSTMQSLANHCIHSVIPFKKGKLELINDTYSANPASIKAACDYIKLFRPPAGGRKIMILADMKELGANSKKFHASLADLFLGSDIDKIYTLGPYMKSLSNALPTERAGLHTEDPQKLLAVLHHELEPGDVVILKGDNHYYAVLNDIAKKLQVM